MAWPPDWLGPDLGYTQADRFGSQKLVTLDKTLHLWQLSHVEVREGSHVNHYLDFVDYGESIAADAVEQARQSAKTFFQNMDQDIKNAILPRNMQTQSPAKAATPPARGPDMNSPQANFVTYHMSQTGNVATTSTAPSPMTNGTGGGKDLTNRAAHGRASGINSRRANGIISIGTDVLEKLVTDIIEPLAKTLMDRLGTDLGDVI